MLSDAPVVTVHIPPALRIHAGGHAELMASGETVGEVFASIAHEYPAMCPHLFAQAAELPSGLTVFLGARDVRELQGLATPIDLEERVSVLLTG